MKKPAFFLILLACVSSIFFNASAASAIKGSWTEFYADSSYTVICGYRGLGDCAYQQGIWTQYWITYPCSYTE